MKLSAQGFVHILIILIGIAVIVSAAVLVPQLRDDDGFSSEGPGPKPSETSLSSFESNEVGYECSRPIEGDWKTIRGQIGQEKWTFVPDSIEELQRWCRTTYTIEYHAVVDLLKRPDISEVIEKYDPTLAWLKVLNYDLIEDETYVDRILPEHSDFNTHCIVVLHSPEGERFFLENGDVEHDYREVPAEEFLASLNSASDEDINQFWLNLR